MVSCDDVGLTDKAKRKAKSATLDAPQLSVQQPDLQGNVLVVVAVSSGLYVCPETIPLLHAFIKSLPDTQPTYTLPIRHTGDQGVNLCGHE